MPWLQTALVDDAIFLGQLSLCAWTIPNGAILPHGRRSAMGTGVRKSALRVSMGGQTEQCAAALTFLNHRIRLGMKQAGKLP
jgi:hypothetical protein